MRFSDNNARKCIFLCEDVDVVYCVVYIAFFSTGPGLLLTKNSTGHNAVFGLKQSKI